MSFFSKKDLSTNNIMLVENDDTVRKNEKLTSIINNN